MKHPALFLLVAAVLSGCSIIRDSQRPQEGAEVLQYKQLFEAGRRSESKGDIKIAGDTYGWLIGRGNRYGEFGLAMLLLRREPGNQEAIKYLLSCAKRSSHTSDLFPDSAIDSAFSAAAMAKLSDIAVSEHDRPDVAASLRNTLSGIITTQVREWAEKVKANEDSAAIYADIISAVESSHQSREYAKPIKWSEISEIFIKGDTVDPVQGDNRYSVVKFVKTPDTWCQYDFEVRLSGNDTFEASEKVRSAIRRLLVKEFLSANPHDDINDVRTSFLSWSQSDSKIIGSVVVLKVSAVRIEYDAVTCRGKVAVRLDGRDVAAARQWATENIAELATGKNIALVVGKPPPPGATYTTGDERTTEDGLLEIEFRTE